MGRLVIVSNRLPLPVEGADHPSAGGVLSALLPAMRDRNGLWLGWSGRVLSHPTVHEQHVDGVDVVAVDLSEAAASGFYNGYSNSTLWPRLHGLDARSRFSPSDYEQYREVNRQFAIHLRVRLRPNDVIWVHDYQFIPLGLELARLGWRGPIGYFHHTPVPDAASWEHIPGAEHLTRALQAYTHIGVQSPRDATHMREILGEGATPVVEVHPVPIDAPRVRASADEALAPFDEEQIAGRAMLFGVDRLDYTKGIPLRLEAWERVLERRPDLRESAVFVQWAAPSRTGVDEYREERAAIEAIESRIAQQYPKQRPLILDLAEHPGSETAAALRRANVCVITSVSDGMNLVSKEFAALHDLDEPGVLVLSEGCGAASQLHAAVIVDRYSVAAVADAIEQALDMTPAERGHRSQTLRAIVDAQSSGDWVDAVTARIEEIHRHAARSADARHRPTMRRREPRPHGDATPPQIVVPAALSRRLDLWGGQMRRTDMIDRLWKQDPTLWPADERTISNRLGWLSFEQWLPEHAPELREFALGMVNEGYTTAVVLGMGGSSAAARVLSRRGDVEPGGLRVLVLDSTVPDAIREVERQVDPGRTLFVVSSKSGGTLETMALFDYFWERDADGRHFVAVTDPGTPLERIAADRGFRRAFLNPESIGGRFSALSYPGLLPAALAGVDLDRLAMHARAMAEACRNANVADNPGAQLGALLAQLGANGRGTLTIAVDDALYGLGDWIAQLVAESSGKDGRGLLPVLDSVPGRPESFGADDAMVAIGDATQDERLQRLERAERIVVRHPLADWHAVAAEFVRWEVAVALACSLLDVNAFDEPDVTLAKEATTAVLAGETPTLSYEADRHDVARTLATPRRGQATHRFIAVHAYLHRTPELERRLRAVQQHLREQHRIPVAIEFGPALQHSTGQYYKGGPGEGLVVQVIDDAAVDLSIPGRAYGFDGLVSAQSRGDAQAMMAAGRTVVRTSLDDLEAATARGRMLEATRHASYRFRALNAQSGSTRVTRVETTRIGRVTPRQPA